MRHTALFLALALIASPSAFAEDAGNLDPFASPLADPFAAPYVEGMPRPEPEPPYVFPDHLEFEYVEFLPLDVVEAVFRESFRRDAVLRMVAAPSWGTEYAVGLEKHGDAFVLFTLRAEQQLWRLPGSDNLVPGEPDIVVTADTPDDDVTLARMEASLAPNLREIGTIRCEIPVETALGERIEEVWREMLFAARYARQPGMGADGVFYRFSYSRFPPMHAVTWSPDTGTTPAMLVHITHLMWGLCEQRDPAIAEELSEQADALLARLADGNIDR